MTLKYHTIQATNTAIKTPTPGGGGVAAVVKLAHKLMFKINEYSVKYAIEKKLAAMDVKIKQIKGNNAGVLVVAQIQEWAIPDATGGRAKTLLSVHIGGAGNDYKIVLKKYLMQPSIVQGPAEGWRTAGNHYIWVSE